MWLNNMAQDRAQQSTANLVSSADIKQLIPDIYHTIVCLAESARSIVRTISNTKSDSHVKDFFTIIELLESFTNSACGHLYRATERQGFPDNPNLEQEWDSFMSKLNNVSGITAFLKVPIEERGQQRNVAAGDAAKTVYELFAEQVPDLLSGLTEFLDAFGISAEEAPRPGMKRRKTDSSAAQFPPVSCKHLYKFI